MKVLLVNPTNTEFTGTGNTTPPLGLLYLAGELRKNNIPVSMLDGCITGTKYILDAIKDTKPDIIGFPVLSPCRHAAWDMLAEIKKVSDANIFCGGAHPTSLQKQVLDNYPVDAVCAGEGEKWISHYALTGESKPDQYADLDDIAFPAWDMVDFDKYAWKIGKELGNRAHVAFSRGCPFVCNFCSTWSIWKTPRGSSKYKNYRMRSPQNTVEELLWLVREFNVNHVSFVDDVMTIDKEITLELCDAIMRENDLKNLKWLATTRINSVDPEILDAMARAGCYKISYGVESASPTVIKTIHKGVDPDKFPEECIQSIRWTMDVGITVNVLMMVGNPAETDETIIESRDFLIKANPSQVGCLGSIWLLPQTALYAKAKKAGYIDDDFWLTREQMMSWPHKPRQLRKWYRTMLSYNRYFYWRNLLATYYPRALIGHICRKFWLLRKFGNKSYAQQIGREQTTASQIL